MKLAGKLTLGYLVSVVLLTYVSSYFIIHRGYEQEEDRHCDLARKLASPHKERMVVAWRQKGREGLVETVRNISAEGQTLGVRWVWFEGETEVDHRPAATVDDPDSLSAGQIITRTTRDSFGVRRLHTYYPVIVDESRHGALEFTGSLETLDEHNRDTIYAALISVGVMALLGVMLSWYAGVNWVARPLDRLIQKTRRIGQGDFSGPVEVRGKDELAELGGALNEMCDQLDRQQATIRSESSKRLAAMEQLRHADRLKTVGRLAAGIAHELGTPLNVVSGRAGLIAAGKLPAEEIRQSAATIKNETDRITATIRRLLDFARHREPHRTRVDLRNVVRHTISLLEPLAEKRNVTIVTQDGGSEIAACIDFDQIQQVLTNVVVNGIQAMSSGGQLAIRVTSERMRPAHEPESTEQDYVRISVSDEGDGIAEEDLPNIFEPFFTTKDVGEGTGLGLSITYNIVQEHGGWIDVSSQTGRGSRFDIFVPKDQPQCEEES